MDQRADAQGDKMRDKTYPYVGSQVDHQMKLVNKDFPWLWAIRQSWWLANRNVRVCNVGLSLEEFLKSPCVPKIGSCTEVWIRRGPWKKDTDKNPFTHVTRVQPGVRVSWAEAIQDPNHCLFVYNVVTIVSQENCIEKMTVFRQKEEFQIQNLVNKIPRS